MKRRVAVATLVAVLALSRAVRAEPPVPQPARRLRTLAHNPDGYQPAQAGLVSEVLLGDLLFHSSSILGERARTLGLSCQSCHPNGAAHTTLTLPGLSDRPGNVDLTTGFFRAGADNQRPDALNIPSLRGVRYTGPYGIDGRTASLAEFIQSVVVDSFGGAPLGPLRLRALLRYVQEQDFLPNRNLDTRNRLSAQASLAARRGEQLFRAPRPSLGPAGCATCHPPTSMFRDGLVHRIGSGAPASPYSLDDAYETPTLLGTMETAPYFHDGRFATLAAVVQWWSTSAELHLTAAEASDLTAYLETIGTADLQKDERTTGQRLAEVSAYLALLHSGETCEDRTIWDAALTALAQALREPPQPAALRPRIQAVEATLHTLRTRAQGQTPLATLRPALAGLRHDVVTLGADWTALLGR